MSAIRFLLSRKKLTNMVMVFVILAGLGSILTNPRQDSPNVDFSMMTIVTFYPGASPEDVEINVTDLIEDELEKVDGIEELTSYSIEGMSYIYAQLDPDSDDTTQIKEDIRSAVDRVSNFPPEVENRPLIEEMKSTDFPVMEVAISGPEHKEEILRKIAKDMESSFKSVGNVGTVDKVGYRKREVQILADAKKMERNHISFGEMIHAINARNVKLSGGTLESFVDEKKIVTFSEFEKLEDVQDVIVRSNFSGKSVRIKDIAVVNVDYRKKDIISRTNGLNSINLVVKRRGTTDVINLSSKVNELIEKYQRTITDPDIKIMKVVDYSYYTRSLLDIVTKNALIGFCLVVTSLFIFLNLRSALWVAVGIPLSILGAYIFFPAFDITTNQVTLITMIMVLGMLVDDAIVIAENINRHQESGMDFKEAAVSGTKEVFQPVLATILTTIMCFVPMYFMKGVVGKFIMAIPTVVILTLLASLVESTTLLPVHLGSRKGAISNRRQEWINKLRERYGRFLKNFLKHRNKTLFGFFMLAVVSTGFFATQSRFELFPTEDFDLFYIVMETKTGTSLEETFKKVEEVEKVVEKIPSNLMLSYRTVVGDHMTLEAASDPSLHENWALISVFLHPASKRDIRSEQIIEDLQGKYVEIAKGFTKFEVRELQDGPPVGAPITIRLVADDFQLAEKYEEQVLGYLKSLEGVYDLETSNRMGKKEVRLKPDYNFMAKVGITAVDLANTIRVAYDGRVATTIRRHGEEIDFRVKLGDKQRGDIKTLKELQILNNQNKLIKLKKFVSFDSGVAKESITHYGGKKAILITGKVHTDKITSREANSLVREKFEERIAGVPGISIVFGGEEKETMESMQNFYMAFLIAIVAIYSILVILLNSFLQPLLIMVAIPFGMIGVLIAFYVHNLPVSFIGMIGTLGMIGVVVNDSLVMVTYLNQLKQKYHRMTLDIIVIGAKTRLRPVMLTTITTVLGLLPTVYGWGGSEPFLVPMVLAMSWGLAFATIITLVLIPVLYTFSRKYEPASE